MVYSILTREPEGLVTGVLLLYSYVPLEEMPQVLSYAVNTILHTHIVCMVHAKIRYAYHETHIHIFYTYFCTNILFQIGVKSMYIDRHRWA